MAGDQHDGQADQLEAEEATALMETLPLSWERLKAARDDIRAGRTFPLDELDERGRVEH